MYGGYKITVRIVLLFLLFTGVLHLNAQQKKYTLVLFRYVGNEGLSSLRPEISIHKNILEDLKSRNQVLLSGTLKENTGYFYLLNTGDKSTARAWFTEDTLIHKNNWKMEFRPFTMIYDKSCGEGIVGENSTDYTLILNYTYLTKFNIREAPLFHKEHENFINEIIKTGNVVLWGILDNTDGTIVLMKGTTDPAIFSLDPMVQSGFIEPETKDVIINSTLPCK